jgi:hypothetical protein
MESRATERNFLSVFFGDVPEFESNAPTQQIPKPTFKSASKTLHTGYIRPLHLIGSEAKPAKLQKKSDDDFWDSQDGSHSSLLPDVEILPNTAAKSAKHQDQKSTTLSSFRKLPSNSVFDAGSVDAILNRVRPGITLNRVQTSVKDCIFNSNESAVVGAPTGKIACAPN